MSLYDDLTTDLAAFFSVSEFAQSVTVSPSTDVERTITAIYDASTDSLPPLIVPVNVSGPHVICKTTDVSDMAQGDTVTVTVSGEEVTYYVITRDDDGTGVTILYLSED